MTAQLEADLSVQRLQASLYEIGFDRVSVSLEQDFGFLLDSSGHGSYREMRHAIWKAAAFLFPLTYVCWPCFESNAGGVPNHHCSSCTCCS